jgi:hypothetical protein
MKFKPKFKYINIDINAYKKELESYLTNRLKESGYKWLDATVRTSTHIPTWSGASRATFQRLAQELGTTVPIGPIVARKDRTSLGLANAQGSGVFIDSAAGSFKFTYATQLRYLAYNEFNPPVPGLPPQPFSNRVRYTPYRFQDKGQAAWEKFAAKTKLPNPYKFIRKGNI